MDSGSYSTDCLEMAMTNLLDSDMLAEERERLVSLCYLLTGDRDNAEDLAQETLVAAWRASNTLRSQERRSAWLSAIARNQCRQWLRHTRRERSHAAHQPLDVIADLADAALPAEGDPLLALERKELTALLAQALALLPAVTRSALISRFVEDLPHSAIAARLHLSPAASIKRVERGVKTLRRALTSTLREETHGAGLRAADDTPWCATQIWCPLCGAARCEGLLEPAAGLLRLRCPACNRGGGELVRSGPSDPLDVVTIKPALNRLLAWIHGYYHQGASAGAVPCMRCNQRVPLRIGHPPLGLQIGTPPRPAAVRHGIYAWCSACNTAAGVEAWWSFTLGLPEVRRFWHEHPRMRALPDRAVSAAGAEAVLTGFESVAGHARIEVTTSASTLAVQHIERSSAR
jgi:RNA polymerase sigma factor (sigma-70 family)